MNSTVVWSCCMVLATNLWQLAGSTHSGGWPDSAAEAGPLQSRRSGRARRSGCG